MNMENTFWTRNNLPASTRETCLSLLVEYLNAREEVRLTRLNERGCRTEVDVKVEELKSEEQGYCSCTYLCTITTGAKIGIGDEMTSTSTIIQLRPPAHTLNLSIAAEAQRVYGSEVVPWVVELDRAEFPGGMKAFEMERVRGMGVGVLLRKKEEMSWEKKVRLMESFAGVIGRAWHATSSESTTRAWQRERGGRADSPISSILSGPEWLGQCGGVVGRNVVLKLDRLTRELPYEELRLRAKETLDKLIGMSEYPVVLNHGDLIPSNILVDPDTWEVKGLVDWAEGEVLPFGTCLYGVEYLLGGLVYPTTTPSPELIVEQRLVFEDPEMMSCSSPPGDGKLGPVFEYCEGADELRRIFWRTLVKGRPDLEKRLDEVKLMRDVGVLLWEGFAWDEGRIDRVVNEEDDVEEMARLRAFLEVDAD